MNIELLNKACPEFIEGNSRIMKSRAASGFMQRESTIRSRHENIFPLSLPTASLRATPLVIPGIFLCDNFSFGYAELHFVFLNIEPLNNKVKKGFAGSSYRFAIAVLHPFVSENSDS